MLGERAGMSGLKRWWRKGALIYTLKGTPAHGHEALFSKQDVWLLVQVSEQAAEGEYETAEVEPPCA